MSLRKTVIFTIVITFIGLFALLIINLRTILSDYFFLQERNSILYDIQRTQMAIQGEVESFHALITDWVKTKNNANTSDSDPFYFRNELASGSLETLRISFAIALDPQGNQIFTFQKSPAPVELTQPDGVNIILALGDQSIAGAYVSRSGSYIIDRQVIKNSQGNTNAILILGRQVDPSRIGSSSLSSGFQIKLALPQEAEIPQDVIALLTRTTSNPQPYIQVQDQDVIVGYSIIKNVFGQPNIILKLTEPRSVYRNGQLMINYLILFLVLASIIFSIIILLLMERLIVSRLLKLSSEVNQITLGGNLSGRVGVTRKDELSKLSQNINSLLISLEKTAREQQESLVTLGRLEQDLREQVNRLETLHEISRSFLPQSDVQVTMTEITRQTVEKLKMESALLAQSTPAHTSLKIVSQNGQLEFRDDDPFLLQLATGIWQRREPHIVIANHENGFEFPDQLEAGAVYFLYETENEAYLFFVLSREAARFSIQKEYLQAFVNLAEIKLQSAFLFEAVRNGRETLSALSHRLVEIQEEERRWIAQELHDEIGQILTGLKLVLDSTAHQSPAHITATLHHAQTIVNDLIGRVRQISLDLRPAMLDDLGLLPSLVWLFERYRQQTGIEIEFSHFNIENLRFLSEHETAVYRVIQEALTNVARHAKTDYVTIQLWSDESSINARIEDHGEGFDLSAVLNSPKTRGLLGIRERITFLKGKLWIDTSPGQGTSLSIELPLGEIAYPPEDIQ